MRKALILLVSSCLLTALYFSCKKSEKTISSASADETMVLNAKNYFYHSSVSSTSPAGPSDQGSLNPLTALSRTIDWDKAYVQKISSGKIVVVPLSFQENWRVGSSSIDSTKRLAINTIYKLLIRQDPAKGYDIRVLASYPDANNVKNSSSFQGINVETDWAGNFITGYNYEKGTTVRIAQRATSHPGVTVTTEQLTVCHYLDVWSCTVDACALEGEILQGCDVYDVGGGFGGDYSVTDLGTVATNPPGNPGTGNGYPAGPYSFGPNGYGYPCGSYTWGSIGPYWYTQPYSVIFTFENANGDLITYGFVSPCMHFSQSVFTQSQADDAFNAAWSYAVGRALRDANTHKILNDTQVKINVQSYMNSYLSGNYGSGNAGFDGVGCSGTGTIPASTVSYCAY